jgi:hypothetical protein
MRLLLLLWQCRWHCWLRISRMMIHEDKQGRK